MTKDFTMATSTLQIRVDSDLRKEAESFFTGAGLDMSSAVRLFLKQVVIRRRMPFEIISESSDPFWSRHTVTAVHLHPEAHYPRSGSLLWVTVLKYQAGNGYTAP